MLQRGLLLTGLAQLLLDRAYEAGAGDALVVPALGPDPLPTTLLASYAGAARCGAVVGVETRGPPGTRRSSRARVAVGC